MNTMILVSDDSPLAAALATLIAISGKAEEAHKILDIQELAETKLLETKKELANLLINMQFESKSKKEDRGVIPNRFRPINNKGFKSNNTYRRKH